MTLTIDTTSLQALPWNHITDYVLAVLASGLGASILMQAVKHYKQWTGKTADTVKNKIYLLTNVFSWLVGLYPALTTISLLPASDHTASKLFITAGTFGLVYKASHLAYRVSVSPLYKKLFPAGTAPVQSSPFANAPDLSTIFPTSAGTNDPQPQQPTPPQLVQ